MSFRDDPENTKEVMRAMMRRIEDLERRRDIPDGIRLVKLGEDLFAENMITGALSPLGQSVQGLAAGPQILSPSTTVDVTNTFATPDAFSETTTNLAVTGDFLGQRLTLLHGGISSGPRVIMGDHGLLVYPDSSMQYGSAALDVGNLTLTGQAETLTITTKYVATRQYGATWGLGIKGGHTYGTQTAAAFQSPGTITMPPAYAPGAGWLVVYIVQYDVYGPEVGQGGLFIGTLTPESDLTVFSGSNGGGNENRVGRDGGYTAMYYYTTEAGTVTGKTANLAGLVGCIASAHVLDTRVPIDPAE